MRLRKRAEDTLPQGKSDKVEINAQLVQQVTDKVYAMWLRDAQIEKERRRRYDQRYHR